MHTKRMRGDSMSTAPPSSTGSSRPARAPAPEGTASSSPATSASPEPWDIVVGDALRGLPASCPHTPQTEADLEGRLFDLRRRLVDRLVRDHALTAEVDTGTADAVVTEGGEPEPAPQQEQALEDLLRHRLPPLAVKPGPFLPVFSAWRSSVMAVLGLLAGSALAQGLSMGGLPINGGLAIIFGMLGVGIALQAAHTLVRAAGEGELALPWGVLPWKKVRRIFRWGLGAVVLLALVRDFLSARDVISELLAAVGSFLSMGVVLPLLTSVWGALAWIALFALCLHRPMLLDKSAFTLRVHEAVRNWWSGAAVASAALAEVARLRRDRKVKQWRQAGSDLYSFAAELPATRREWLEDRLRLLGLESPRERGVIIWDATLRDRYDILGHVEVGDRCYEDQPPLLEQGQLLRKGVLRKVRN